MNKILFGTIISGALTLIGVATPASALSTKQDIGTPESYTNHVINEAIDVDNRYGCQCVDLFSDFHYAYTGRWLSTAGTGAAYGLWDARDYNAGSDYTLITDPKQLQPGDFVILGGGEYGHVGMATSNYDNGYVALLGENQGGIRCKNGGSTTNIIRISLSNFRGAFRPKIYIKETPKPKVKKEPVEEITIEVEDVEEEPYKIILFNTEKTLMIDSIL